MSEFGKTEREGAQERKRKRKRERGIREIIRRHLACAKR